MGMRGLFGTFRNTGPSPDCSERSCYLATLGLRPALAALALEMELIAKPARSSAGVPAAAVYRR